ncbi:uncharacterized protein LOC143601893, partial [Bidens hawaiensis]|uniref:uncharacterized protein LOC143601893 n=1 Tax=Bidens hawaiensis TaxID=980011 RepID=UPI00404B692F
MTSNAAQKDKIEELKASNAAQKDTIDDLKQKIAFLEKNLSGFKLLTFQAEAQSEIKNLKGTCVTSELETCVEVNDIELNEVSLPDDPILLIGGYEYDGESWLSSLDCYSPSQNLTKSLSPMNTKRCNAAVSKLDGELFVFGGESHGHWFDTVESYDPVDDRWTTCPPLNKKNRNLAGATVKDKVYAVGGGYGEDFYSSVEVLDFDVGAWIPARSMLEKRFALAAAELNGALYAIGGYDGTNYL